ncbi:hypothetical protein [Myroides odoratimimus]|uniref:Uncharacterized protein n=1 Tax=Myroides odoratimimus CIP 101113 TaxID=883154 RepID=A0AAV3F5B3_9FLAO|nr:hypothetical protein [Myroides odoratimimus]EHO13818.1 hypothetical protein HMPREF9715_00892 [Myroides odoratimimus CIP 101113]
MKISLDQVDIKDIYDFMERGDVNNAPLHIVEYLELLDKVRGMALRIDKFGSKEAIVKHLIVVDKLSRYKANQVYDEAIEYFYSDSKISKQAWRNLYADKAEKALHFAMLQMRDASDASKVVKMAQEIAILRGINEPDKEVLNEDVFKAPIKIYTADAEKLGLKTAPNRTELAKLLDELPELTENVRSRIKSEAGLLPFKLFLDEQEDPRKS